MTRPDQAQDDALLAVAREHWDRKPDEVWMPPGLVFGIGDRVRIRLSKECRQEWACGKPGLDGHDMACDGIVGTIIRRLPPGERSWSASHPYNVRVAPRIDSRDGLGFNGLYLAASELIPIAPELQPAAPTDAGDGEG
jgi:hypothetical protein